MYVRLTNCAITNVSRVIRFSPSSRRLASLRYISIGQLAVSHAQTHESTCTYKAAIFRLNKIFGHLSRYNLLAPRHDRILKYEINFVAVQFVDYSRMTIKKRTVGTITQFDKKEKARKLHEWNAVARIVEIKFKLKTPAPL